MDLTGIITCAFVFGIFVIIMSMISMIPYVKDVKRLKKKEYEEYTIIKKEEIEEPESIEALGIEQEFYRYTLVGRNGCADTFETGQNFYQEGYTYRFRKNNNSYESVGYTKRPGILSYMAFIYGVILLLIGVGLVFREQLNISVQIIAKAYIIVGIIFPGIFFGMRSLINNFRICRKENLITAKVADYRWNQYFTSKGVKIALVMYVSYINNGKVVTWPVQKVVENGRIQRKYPVGSDVRVYVNPRWNYMIQNGNNNNIILKNKKMRGFWTGIMVVLGSLFFLIIVLNPNTILS